MCCENVPPGIWTFPFKVPRMLPDGCDVEFFERLFSDFQETLNKFPEPLLKDVPSLYPLTVIIRTLAIFFLQDLFLQ